MGKRSQLALYFEGPLPSPFLILYSFGGLWGLLSRAIMDTLRSFSLSSCTDVVCAFLIQSRSRLVSMRSAVARFAGGGTFARARKRWTGLRLLSFSNSKPLPKYPAVLSYLLRPPPPRSSTFSCLMTS